MWICSISDYQRPHSHPHMFHNSFPVPTSPQWPELSYVAFLLIASWSYPNPCCGVIWWVPRRALDTKPRCIAAPHCVTKSLLLRCSDSVAALFCWISSLWASRLMTSTASDPSLSLHSVCLQEKNGLSLVPYLYVCGNIGHDQQAPQSSFFFFNVRIIKYLAHQIVCPDCSNICI